MELSCDVSIVLKNNSKCRGVSGKSYLIFLAKHDEDIHEMFCIQNEKEDFFFDAVYIFLGEIIISGYCFISRA